MTKESTLGAACDELNRLLLKAESTFGGLPEVTLYEPAQTISWRKVGSSWGIFILTSETWARAHTCGIRDRVYVAHQLFKLREEGVKEESRLHRQVLEAVAKCEEFINAPR